MKSAGHDGHSQWKLIIMVDKAMNPRTLAPDKDTMSVLQILDAKRSADPLLITSVAVATEVKIRIRDRYYRITNELVYHVENEI